MVASNLVTVIPHHRITYKGVREIHHWDGIEVYGKWELVSVIHKSTSLYSEVRVYEDDKEDFDKKLRAMIVDDSWDVHIEDYQLGE